MTLAPILLERLSSTLVEQLVRAEVGHCMRVDHLASDDADKVVKLANESDPNSSVLVRLLTPVRHAHPLGVTVEQAVERRNRKDARLCLLVPSGYSDTAVSSLGNSFSIFDLASFFRVEAARIAGELAEPEAGYVRRLRDSLRGPFEVADEHWADYLATISSDLGPSSMGLGLWRVGLIPDAGEDFVLRLPENRLCASKLTRSKRPHSTAAERLDDIGFVAGTSRDNVLSFLGQHRLQDSRRWLRDLASPASAGKLTFDCWALETDSSGDLESVDVAPLLKPNGDVDRTTKLLQEASGSQPYAIVGEGRSIRIKWTTSPRTTESVARWRAELIPSRDEYPADEGAISELPAAHAASRSRTVSVPLDVDLDETSIRAVQVRIVGLTEHGVEVSLDGLPIEGISAEFWLREGSEGSEPVGGNRRETVPTLPLGRLNVAATSKAISIEEAPPQWAEDDLHYFSVTLNGRRTVRIGVSPALRALEERRLLEAEGDGRFSAEMDATERLDVGEMLSTESADELAGSDVGKKLAKHRKEIFSLLDGQQHRRLVETAVWDAELSKRVRSYAAAYREALTAAEGPLLEDLLTMDSMRLTVRQPHGDEHALVTLPTHPLRLLWYSAYAELLSSWEGELLDQEGDRERLLDLSLISRVAPLNTPTFGVWRGEPFLFAQNIRFFWGLSLPVDAADPARRAADVARAFGLHEDEASLSDLPPARLSSEIDSYRQLHPYMDALRLKVVNPGSGTFLAKAIEGSGVLQPVVSELGEVLSEPPRLEILAQAGEPLPVAITGIQDLQSHVYESPHRVGESLSPVFSVTLGTTESADPMPGGEVNLSVLMDTMRPEIRVAADATREDSTSFYGLLMRLVPTFGWDGATAQWQHLVALPDEAPRERHPVTPTYTNELVEGARAFLAGVGRVLQGTGMPSVTSRLTPDERGAWDRVHEDSDWVVALDRFLGVDYFDDASNPDLDRVAKRYLLDYAPEFLEGLGHRMFVTTSQREEVETLLVRAMTDLGFGLVEESVGDVLNHLKTISGRIALRTIGDEARAREAVSLGVVAAYLHSVGELVDTILIPVDAHPELFGVAARPAHLGTPRSRCDLVQVRFTKRKILVRFIETKSRSSSGASDELLNRIVDQIVATEQVFRDLFFRADPPRLDHVLQRSRLATILRFYLGRAARHGLISSPDVLADMEDAIGRLESGLPDMQVERRGYVVNLPALPERPIRMRDTEIRVLTKDDLLLAGFVPSELPAPDAGVLPVESTPVEATPVQPTSVQPTPVQPAPVEPAPVQPTPVEPAPVEPAPVEPAPVEPAPVEPAPVEPDEIAISLGLTELDQEEVVWRPRVQGSPHMFVLGIPGQGKSWTIMRVLTELHAQGLPALVFDFHGQFSDSTGPYLRTAQPVVLDASVGLPFSPFEADIDQSTGARYWKTNAFAMAEIFQYVCGLGIIQQDLVFQAIRGAYEDAGFATRDDSRLPTVNELADRLAELESTMGVRNVLPRCRPLLEFNLFPSEPGSDLAFSDVVSRGAVLDVSGVGLEAVQLGASAFVLRKVYKDMFAWGETDSLRLVLVLDEAHRLTKDITLPKIMKEGRKFGVAVVVASQGMADFHQDVLGNAGTKVVFRTNFPMSKKVAGFLRADKSVDLPGAIEQLEVGEAYVQTPEMSRCSRTRMHPLH